MPAISEYTKVIRPDTNGTFVAYIPAIAGCHAIGSTADEAERELVNVFSMIEQEYLDSGKQLPPDVREIIALAS